MDFCHTCGRRVVGIIRVGGGRLGRRGDTTISSVGFRRVDGDGGHSAIGTPMSARKGGTMWVWVGQVGDGGTITLGSLRTCVLSIGRGLGVPVGLGTIGSGCGSCGDASKG